jgi:hypothetical protein
MKKPSKNQKRYRKSTPLSRLKSNILKMVRLGDIVRKRLQSWKPKAGSSFESQWAQCMENLKRSRDQINLLLSSVGQLEDGGFKPETQPAIWQPEVGQSVAVAKKYRERYEMIYAEVLRDDPEMLDRLVVRSILPSKEVVVQRNTRTPFAVCKTHLIPLTE